MEQNKLKKMVSALPNYDLKAIAKDIVEFKASMVVPEGSFKNYIKIIKKELPTIDYSAALSVTLCLVQDEIIERYAK